jgi:hypothetical protein
MPVVYKNNKPFCNISNQITPSSLGKGIKHRDSYRVMALFVTEINPPAYKYWYVVDGDGIKSSLENWVAANIKLDFRNPLHLQRIDLYRGFGLTEKQVAKVFRCSTKHLQNHYPKRQSQVTQQRRLNETNQRTS